MADDIWAQLAAATGFQWDAGNAAKNRAGHAVAQAEAEQVFFGAPLLIAPDVTHSRVEPRHLALGQTIEGRRLLVVFTLRGTLVRVISARTMSRRERKVYGDAEAQEQVDPDV